MLFCCVLAFLFAFVFVWFCMVGVYICFLCVLIFLLCFYCGFGGFFGVSVFVCSFCVCWCNRVSFFGNVFVFCFFVVLCFDGMRL